MSNDPNFLPSLIYGTAWKKERTADLVEKAILAGFRGIDTACQPRHYHEAGVGEALDRLQSHGILRNQLYLQTKFTPLAGQDPSSVPYDPMSSLTEQVDQSFHISLKNVHVTYLDALLLHSPLQRHEETMQAWHAMEKLQQQGLVRMIGISNCYDPAAFKRLYDEAIVKPSIIQNRFYIDTDYDKALRKWCREKQITYQSFWTLTANPRILHHPLVISIAASKQVTSEQLFFRFLTQQQIVPLIGSCSEKHMREDLAIFDFTLPETETAQLNKLF